jgi:FtsP/CotA-like multicopper oxidase with cupredoxin domain
MTAKATLPHPATQPAKRPAALNRREMLRKLGLSGGALLGLRGLWPNVALGQGVPSAPGAVDLYIEKYPTSPLILEPFKDELPIPSPYRPLTASELVNRWPIMPQRNCQDSDAGTHQVWPSKSAAGLFLPEPLIYEVRLQVAEHAFTSSKVLPIDKNGDPVTPPGGSPGPQTLPPSTIYGFNGTFPGPMLYARYGQPLLVRFLNQLDNENGLDVGDFGDPERRFLTHLHNAHTAPESDGNPHHKPGAHRPGGWCDNLYLNYPAGGDSREMQSFLWFHDHTHGHTGSNVYKGMVGIYPIYDPANDPGDELRGYRLPGVPRYLGGQPTSGIDYDQPIDYDIPLVLFDCRFDDGETPHKDAHSGLGESHPEWWGKTFYKHFPNKGFVGDVFTVNGTACPVLKVQRRRYRLRFLCASIARAYDLKLMQGTVEAAPGQQGQYNMRRIVDGLGNVTLDAQQCMVFTQIATDGGLLPLPIVRDSFELWPSKRREVIVDFSKYMDGTSTTKGDVIYLVNTMKMVNGRKPNTTPNHTVHLPDGTTRVEPDPDFDPSYAVPLMKIVIGDDPPTPDNSIDPLDYTNLVNGKATLRMVTDPATGLPVPALRMRALPNLPQSFKGAIIREFELQRSGTYGGEIEWLINGHAFDRADAAGMFPQAVVTQGRPELWVIRNGGGGWTHPMHMHQEEHRVISRNGIPTGSPDADPRHVDDFGRFDVVNLDPSEEVIIYRNFRSFVGKYVAHCHNLAHEDHAMMFGWEIRPPVV